MHSFLHQSISFCLLEELAYIHIKSANYQKEKIINKKKASLNLDKMCIFHNLIFIDPEVLPSFLKLRSRGD